MFAVFVQDPRWGRADFDLIWVPEHDALRGDNVLATLTSPHPFSPARLAAARAAPDPRIARLAGAALRRRARRLQRRAAFHRRRPQADRRGAARHSRAGLLADGHAVAPHAAGDLAEVARAEVGDGFFWDGTGDNPYPAMLALADALLVTGDSANMVGEAAATGRPVHVFEPSGGGSRKLAGSIDALVARGAVRRWAGRIESFSYEPIDSSAEIAAEIRRRYVARERIARPAA